MASVNQNNERAKKAKYKNVIAELVTLYSNLCESYQKQKSLPKKRTSYKADIRQEC